MADFQPIPDIEAAYQLAISQPAKSWPQETYSAPDRAIPTVLPRFHAKNRRKDADAAESSRRAKGLIECLWNNCAPKGRNYLQT
jgi:hypothetical protein